MKNKAIFLDRDGVLNHEIGDYICQPEHFEVLEYNIAPLKALQDQGYLLIVITNQGGIAKGRYTEQTLAEIHLILKETYAAHGAHIDDIFYCPHHPDFTGVCNCYKPKPGMLFDAIAKYDIDPAASIMIGDKERDVQAAAAAGVKGLLIHPDEQISLDKVQAMLIN